VAFKKDALKSGQVNIIVVTLNTILIELEIDPAEVSSQDDKYTLFCSDDKSIYSKTLTVKDDLIPGDDFLTLKFIKLESDHNYSLEIDPGTEGEPYFLFEKVPLEDLLSGSFSFTGSKEDDPELDPDYEENEDQNLPYDDKDPDDEELESDDWEMESDDKLIEEWEQESDDAYTDSDDDDEEEDD
jgi:hypothetical protein